MAASSNGKARPGDIECLTSNCFRAHVQRRASSGQKQHIIGPRRVDKRKAEQDLEAIREASRDPNAWDAMAAAARRLQERAEFEGKVAVCAAAITSESNALPVKQSEPDEDTDSSDSQPYDPNAYYNDANELWQEIDEEGRLPPNYTRPPRIPVADPKDSIEATTLLNKFRPTRMTAADLQKLLTARADPNIMLGDGDIHPLMNVMTFAPADSVCEMRDMLLSAGANETEDLRKRWVIRKRADACHDAWMRNFHRDPR